MSWTRPGSAPVGASQQKTSRPLDSLPTRPATAGFVGAFRAVVKKGHQNVKPRAQCSQLFASRSKKSLDAEASPANLVAGNPIASKALGARARASSEPLGRQCVAPRKNMNGRTRREYEEDKKPSEWAMLARYANHLDDQQRLLQINARNAIVEREREELEDHFVRVGDKRKMERKRRQAERKMIQEVCKEDKEYEAEQQQLARKQRLDLQAWKKVQIQESKQRHEREKARRLQEDLLARQDCMREMAEAEVERQIHKEKLREVSAHACAQFEEQEIMKKQIAEDVRQLEKKLAIEQNQKMQREDDARKAALQKMADGIAARMAMNKDAQEHSKRLNDAIDDRIQSHIEKKIADDEIKLKMQQAARQQQLQEFARHRKEQIEHNVQLEKARSEQEKLLAKDMRARAEEEQAKERKRAAALRARDKEYEQYLLAQICEKRARPEVEMSSYERGLNRSSLETASAALSQAALV